MSVCSWFFVAGLQFSYWLLVQASPQTKLNMRILWKVFLPSYIGFNSGEEFSIRIHDPSLIALSNLLPYLSCYLFSSQPACCISCAYSWKLLQSVLHFSLQMYLSILLSSTCVLGPSKLMSTAALQICSAYFDPSICLWLSCLAHPSSFSPITWIGALPVDC